MTTIVSHHDIPTGAYLAWKRHGFLEGFWVIQPDTARVVTVGGAAISNMCPSVLIAGPCQIESRSHALQVAQALWSIIYKFSYDMANRTSATAARGVGMAILSDVGKATELPVPTDVHTAADCVPVADDPDKAPSDGPNMTPLWEMEALVTRSAAFDPLAKQGA